MRRWWRKSFVTLLLHVIGQCTAANASPLLRAGNVRALVRPPAFSFCRGTRRLPLRLRGGGGSTTIDDRSGAGDTRRSKRPKTSASARAVMGGLAARGHDLDDKLVQAVVEGNHALLHQLVAQGARVNQTADASATGDSPLHMAASRGLTSCVAALVELGAHVNAVDSLGNTPLHDAALHGHTGALVKLVEGRANLEAKNVHGLHAVHCAAANGHTATIKVLLALGAHAAPHSESGATPLRWAAVRGHVSAVRLLLQQSPPSATLPAPPSNASHGAAGSIAPAPTRTRGAAAVADAQQELIVTAMAAVEAAVRRERERGGGVRRLLEVTDVLREWQSGGGEGGAGAGKELSGGVGQADAVARDSVGDAGRAGDEDVEGGSRDEVKGGRNATELLRRLEHLGEGAVGLSGEGQRVGGLGSVMHAPGDGRREEISRPSRAYHDQEHQVVRQSGDSGRGEDGEGRLGGGVTYACLPLGMGQNFPVGDADDLDQGKLAADLDWWETQVEGGEGGYNRSATWETGAAGKGAEGERVNKIGGPYLGLGERFPCVPICECVW